jgi:mono/diheme cytochrome c family protein
VSPAGAVVASAPVLLAITTTGKVVLLLVAGSFIAFALIVSMLVPRRKPGFPGSHLGVFIAVCVAFFAAELGAVVWVTGTQEVTEASAEAPAETTPAETTPAETTPTATTPAETTPASQPGDAAAGKQVFLTAGCAGCHTLADAGTNGTVGPNLDDKKPPYELVVDRVTNGKGVMPKFGGQLTEQQIQNVAKYVSSVAGQ